MVRRGDVSVHAKVNRYTFRGRNSAILMFSSMQVYSVKNESALRGIGSFLIEKTLFWNDFVHHGGIQRSTKVIPLCKNGKKTCSSRIHMSKTGILMYAF